MLFLFLFFALGQLCHSSKISLGMVEDPKNLDPIMFSGSSMAITANIYEGLVRVEDGSIVPGLAEGWIASDQSIVFALREGVKWSDGESIKIEDFIFSARRLLSPKSISPFCSTYYPIKNAEAFHRGEKSFEEVGIKKIDDRHLEIIFEHPADDLMECWGSIFAFTPFSPLRESVYGMSEGEKFGQSLESIDCCGPYRVSEWNASSYIVLEANPFYYKDLKIKRIECLIVKDYSTMVKMYNANELTLILSLGIKENGIPEVEIFEYPNENRVTYVGFNTKGNLSDKNLRRAIALSIDRDRLCNFVLSGQAIPAKKFTPNHIDYGIERKNFTLFESSKREAIKELKKSKGEIESLTLICGGGEISLKVAQYIAEEIYETLGIEVEIEVLSMASKVAREEKKDYDIAISGYMVDHSGPPFDFLTPFTKGSSYNRTGWSSCEFDALIEESKRVYLLNDKLRALLSAEMLICDKKEGAFPVAPLYYRKLRYAKKSWIKNVKIYGGAGSPDFREAYLKF